MTYKPHVLINAFYSVLAIGEDPYQLAQEAYEYGYTGSSLLFQWALPVEPALYMHVFPPPDVTFEGEFSYWLDHLWAEERAADGYDDEEE